MGKIVDYVFSSAKMVIANGLNMPHFRKQDLHTATQILRVSWKRKSLYQEGKEVQKGEILWHGYSWILRFPRT